MTSDPVLRRLYLKYNKLLFNNELPLDVAIYWAPTGDAVGLTTDAGSASPKLITIDPVLGSLPRFVRQTIIHEMAHVKLWPLGRNVAHHGKAWDKEIQRLTTFYAYRRML